MRPREVLILLLLASSFAKGQSTPEQVGSILERQIQTASVARFQLQQYLIQRAPKLPAPTNAQQWRDEAARLRKHLLDDVIFHGWPAEWVNAPCKFEDQGEIESAKGYRMRKLRYEIVPGFQATAILYEPDNLSGKAPAVLNVNGHVGPLGKAIEYKQKRCINYARRGMLALNLEWLSFGELSHAENRHWFGAHLDLVGANAVGLFYLAMRNGLDYLYEHPHVDRSRIGVTGLSGGGWQTILLSSLDERVTVAIPVAGYASLVSRLERPLDVGDIEQNGTDLLVGQDYPHLTAMRAPRPTLLIYNAEDECCFRAPLVKSYIFDDVKPFFSLFGKENLFVWHENTDPSTHNYQLDNRQQSYRFFSKYFNLPVVESEIVVDAEIKSYEELVVGLPEDNLTILGLAKKLAGEIKHQPLPLVAPARAEWAAAERSKLKTLVRYSPASVKQAWAVANTKNRGLETRSYLFEFSNGLSGTGVWLKATTSLDNAPVTIILHDDGKKSARAEVSERVNRGEQVVAVDLLFTGDASPENPGPSAYTQLLATTGDRPIGMEAAQLIGIARWLSQMSRAQQVRLESTGIRNQVTALVASALEPTLFSEVLISRGMPSFRYLLDAPVTYQLAPDLFCLDLYKEFDLDRLALLAEPAKVRQKVPR